MAVGKHSAIKLSYPKGVPVLPSEATRMKAEQSATVVPLSVPAWIPPVPRMEECCIIVLHHRDDEVTRNHIDLIRQYNPYPVVPAHNSQPHIAGALDVGMQQFAHEEKWAYMDNAFYGFFQKRPFNAKRYVFLEWDVLVTQPVREFYGDLWDSPNVVINALYPNKNKWRRFREIKRMPLAWQAHAAAVVPLGVVMVSHACLEAVCRLAIPKNIYSELRFGTAIQVAGYPLIEHPTGRSTISWTAKDIIVDASARTIYHPVKS